MICEKLKEETVAYCQKTESDSKNNIHNNASCKDPVYVVLKKAMVSVSFTNMPHNLTIHASIKNESIYPACFND